MMQPEKEFEVFWEEERLEWPTSMAENPMLKDAVYAGWKAGKSTNDDTSHAEGSKQWTCEDQQAGKLPETGSLVMTEFTEYQEARFLGRTIIDDGSWRWVVRYLSNGLCGLMLPERCYPVGVIPNSTVSDRDFADLVNSLRDTATEYAGTQQLRAQIANSLKDVKFFLKPPFPALNIKFEPEDADTKRLDYLLNSAGDEIWQTVLFAYRSFKTPREAIDAAIEDTRYGYKDKQR